MLWYDVSLGFPVSLVASTISDIFGICGQRYTDSDSLYEKLGKSEIRPASFTDNTKDALIVLSSPVTLTSIKHHSL